MGGLGLQHGDAFGDHFHRVKEEQAGAGSALMKVLGVGLLVMRVTGSSVACRSSQGPVSSDLGAQARAYLLGEMGCVGVPGGSLTPEGIWPLLVVGSAGAESEAAGGVRWGLHGETEVDGLPEVLSQASQTTGECEWLRPG